MRYDRLSLGASSEAREIGGSCAYPYGTPSGVTETGGDEKIYPVGYPGGVEIYPFGSPGG